MLDIIHPPGLPPPTGHYSPAIVANGFVFVAGQLPFTIDRSVPPGIAAQADLVLRNLGIVLEASRSSPSHVVTLQIFLSDTAHWGEVNAACERFFQAHRPARTVVPCSPLRHGALLELNAIAVLAQPNSS